MNLKIVLFIKKLDMLVSDKEYKDKLRSLLNKYIDGDNYSIKGNTLTFENAKNIIQVTISKDKVTCIETIGETIKREHNYIKKGNINYTCDSEIETQICDSPICIFKTVNSKYDKSLYDNTGLELTHITNYTNSRTIEDKKTHEVILPEPKCNENYTETSYFWMIDGVVLKRIIKKYKYPDKTPAFIPIEYENGTYLRVKEPFIKELNNKKIPRSGCFYEFNKNLFYSLKKGESTLDEIKEDVMLKKYHFPHTIWF